MVNDSTKPDDESVQIGPSAPPLQWNERRERAAWLLAEDELTDEQIAADCGIARATLATWKRHPDFNERVAENVAKLGANIAGIAIARRRNRVLRLQDMIDRLERVIHARALAADTAEEQTGLIVSKPHFNVFGEESREYKFDAALVREYRATLEMAAKELGQLTEKVELTQETIVRRYIGVDMEAV